MKRGRLSKHSGTAISRVPPGEMPFWAAQAAVTLGAAPQPVRGFRYQTVSGRNKDVGIHGGQQSGHGINVSDTETLLGTCR
jgi:hypothetical protein